MSDPHFDDEKFEQLYRTASDFMRYEGELVWSRFSGMAVVHSILIGLLADAGGYGDLTLFAGLIVAVAGLILTLFWRKMLELGISYHDAWKDTMRTAEIRLYRGHPVTNALQQMVTSVNRAHARWGRAHDAQGWVIRIFQFLYVALIAVYVIEIVDICADL